jgi:spermidine/putrescine transport system substrate-binding protein
MTLKPFLLAAAAAVLALGTAPVLAEGQLRLYHWFEYIPQELVDKFEQEHGVDVTVDTYDSNEALLAALKAGGLGQYDLAVPGDYMVKILAHEEMLDTIAEGELKNKGNILEEWLDVPFDPGRQHSIPYQWGTTSFAVNRNAYEDGIRDTAIIFDPPDELKGKINVLDTQGETLGLASLHLGIPQCTQDREQLKALDELMHTAKPHWASFNSAGAKDVLVSGDALAGMIWNGFGMKARLEGAPIEYSYPKQGQIVWMDNVALLKDAPNRENALMFMDFLLEPENAAAVTNYARYTSGVEGVEPFLDEELKTAPEVNPPADAGPNVFVEVCDEETQKLYTRIWTRVKQ